MQIINCKLIRTPTKQKSFPDLSETAILFPKTTCKVSKRDPWLINVLGIDKSWVTLIEKWFLVISFYGIWGDCVICVTITVTLFYGQHKLQSIFNQNYKKLSWVGWTISDKSRSLLVSELSIKYRGLWKSNKHHLIFVFLVYNFHRKKSVPSQLFFSIW